MADYVTAIRTADGVKKIDYNSLANLPKNMTPKSHVSTHEIGGSDPLWLATTSKAGLMSSSDKSKLDKVNVDKIESINKLNSYVWQRRTKETSLHTSDAETKHFLVGMYDVNPGGSFNGQVIEPSQIFQPSPQTIYYASSYTSAVNASDKVVFTLKDPTSLYLTVDVADKTILNAVKGKYWYTSSAASDVIYYTPADAEDSTFTGPTLTNGWLIGGASYYISAQTLTGQLNVGTWELVYSDSSTAYPHSGIKNGYEYIYYGGLESRLTSCACETGYYLGTGTVGTSGKSSLTFSFVPRYVKIVSSLSLNSYLVFLNPLTISGSSGTVQTCSWNNETLTWWCTTSADAQLNASGVKYYYVAWG